MATTYRTTVNLTPDELVAIIAQHFGVQANHIEPAFNVSDVSDDRAGRAEYAFTGVAIAFTVPVQIHPQLPAGDAAK